MPSAKSKKMMTGSGSGNRSKKKNKKGSSSNSKEPVAASNGKKSPEEKEKGEEDQRQINEEKCINNNVDGGGLGKVGSPAVHEAGDAGGGDVPLNSSMVRPSKVNLTNGDSIEIGTDKTPPEPKSLEPKRDLREATHLNPRVGNKTRDFGGGNGVDSFEKKSVLILSPDAKPFEMKRHFMEPFKFNNNNHKISRPLINRSPPDFLAKKHPTIPKPIPVPNATMTTCTSLEKSMLDESPILRSPQIESAPAAVKHPLLFPWTFWYFYRPGSSKVSWEDSLTKVLTVEYIEDFWGLFHHTTPPSNCKTGSDYSLFKAGVKPMWEDEKNKRGGRWVMNLDKNNKDVLINTLWLEIMMFLIGSNLDSKLLGIINGAVLNVRNKGNKLALWLDYADLDTYHQIGMILKKKVLKLPPDMSIFFEAHVDTMNKTGSACSKLLTL